MSSLMMINDDDSCGRTFNRPLRYRAVGFCGVSFFEIGKSYKTQTTRSPVETLINTMRGHIPK